MTVATPGSDSSMEQGPGPRPLTRYVQSGRTTAEAGLAIWTDQGQNRCVLRLTGRLCAETVRLLDSHVDLLGCRTCEDVVIDLAGLDTMDQVGARLIVGFGHYVAGRGGRFRVEGAADPIRSRIARAEIELSS